MDSKSLAPCGVICDICIGYLRTKDKCVGCNHEGNKPKHCTSCSIKLCPEKGSDQEALCIDCKKYPCRRIKDLNKRYTTKYGEDLFFNFKECKEKGKDVFIKEQSAKWICPNCGKILCVHREKCLFCGSDNIYFPKSTC